MDPAVAYCPKGSACASCTRNTPDLAVTVIDTEVGGCCLTLCGDCRHVGWIPPWSLPQLMYRTRIHSTHIAQEGTR